MLKTLASHNPDLEKLLEKGYALAIDTDHLIIRDIPYLDSTGQLQWSAFASNLVFEDQTTVRPNNHQMYFAGPRPFGLDEQVVKGLGGGEGHVALSDRCNDFKLQQLFSHKLKENGVARDYLDHFEKVESHVAMICAPAMQKFGVTPLTFRHYEEEVPHSVFKLRDTLTSRAEISDLSKLFEHEVVAIIGLGGSGSYLLDFIAKTPVKEIRAFDADSYFVHNAFRSPGRVDTEEGKELRKSKAEVYRNRYENFRHGLTIKSLFVDETTAAEFDGVTFAFVAVDKGSSRKRIFDILIASNIPFIDVGLGLKRQAGPISGMVRTTYFSGGDERDVRSKGFVPEADHPDDVYKSNIQIAELNALNAALAVVRFKQIRGFYRGPSHHDQMLLTVDNLSLLAPDEH
jgi:hypothetical protein